jgi:hypothetical protein
MRLKVAFLFPKSTQAQEKIRMYEGGSRRT